LPGGRADSDARREPRGRLRKPAGDRFG